jgi:hypothetical protein
MYHPYRNCLEAAAMQLFLSFTDCFFLPLKSPGGGAPFTGVNVTFTMFSLNFCFAISDLNKAPQAPPIFIPSLRVYVYVYTYINLKTRQKKKGGIKHTYVFSGSRSQNIYRMLLRNLLSKLSLWSTFSLSGFKAKFEASLAPSPG